ncbi:nucleoside hydrolase [Parasediminibacterium sp. JCM 36343]|uniref:nucleoside hydrolase n=1 Tax=Parasediminibacterium sp. JCM 36343 TaxID=3374279 RepID=UPI00397A3B5E
MLALILISGLNANAQKHKVLLDFDIGDDFDDANALALLLASPEIDVIGVVVDFGNTPKRAQVACRMLYEVGREDIPVAIGRQTNDEFTMKHFYTEQFYWGEGFEKVKPIKQSGTDFIIEKLRKYPNEITLVTIGPVTNMGDVVDKDPDALKLAKHVYAMFGSFYMGYGSSPIPCAEWNVKADIKASQKFAASGAKFTFAGLDVTTFVRLKKEYIELLMQRNSPLTNAVLSLFSLSSLERKQPEPIIYDAVTIGMILWPEVFDTRKAYVTVDDKGYTIIVDSKAPNCEIATNIRMEEYFDKYIHTMLRQNLMRK